jgi:hypothetical protein
VTPAQLLEVTAADMRAVAGAATEGGWVRSWTGAVEGAEIPGYSQPYRPSVVDGFLDGDEWRGADDGDLTHITAWDPDVARAVAAWLDAEAAAYGKHRPKAQGQLVDVGPCGPLKLALCRAWWASRDLDPEAVTR